MKHIITTFALLVLFVSVLSAQATNTYSQQITWKGIEKWYLGTNSIDVLSFENAQYPTDNHLPYFNKRIAYDRTFSYQIEVKNAVYSPLTNEEEVLINGNSVIKNKLETVTDILQEQGTSWLNISLLPIVNQDGKFLKLLSFDLVVTKIPAAQKVAAATMHTYASSSVLKQGKFVKLKIATTGVYKLTYDDLRSMGIEPSQVRIFGYGGGVLNQSFTASKIDDLPEVSIYNGSDYILFYAQGATKWTYDSSRAVFTHSVNPYSKFGYYFVTADAGTGKKISAKTLTTPANATVETKEEFTDYQVYEKDLFNFTLSGKEFYGESFNDVVSQNFTFTFPNPVLTNTTNVQLDVASTSTTASSFTVSLNSAQSKSLTVPARVSDNYTQAAGASGLFTFTPTNETFTFNLTYNKTNSSSIGYLNFIEVNARRQLKMVGSVMPFRNMDNIGTTKYTNYKLSDATSSVQIWDVSDPANINAITTENVSGKLSFTAPTTETTQYIAIDPTAASAFQKPTIGDVVANQNLHGLDPVDFVILTHPDFVSQAEQLAEAHRTKDNLTVAVVTTDQVYNEFSSGTPDATAYRWVMKMLYDKALAAGNANDIPKYLLLFGRGTYDNRKIRNDSGNNLILTYQTENSLVTTSSYTTDDYFTLLDDSEGANVPGGLMDIGVGRLPVTTQQQASNVVAKITNYMNNSDKGNWKNQLCYLADDGDQALHMTQADTVSSSVARTYPSYQVNKIYLDAFQQEVSASGESYPLAKSKFQNLLRSGLFLLDYTGHAGATGWGNEGILSINDVKALSNTHLPMFMGATCDFLQFDIESVSAGEQVILNPSGGGIGIMSAARPVYAGQNMILNKLFSQNLFKKVNGQEMRLGDIIRLSKNAIGAEINKLCYVFMGDPALRLNYPSKYKIVTKQINTSTTLGNDTLRALSVAKIQGTINDDNGAKIENFNGTLHIVVYDKVQRITTLNNHSDGTLTYSDRPNTLFSGDAAVKDGAFSFTFMIPKDIKYNYGSGRINYYAEDNTNDYEAQGNFENFTIGGTDINNIADTVGPDVKMYLNSTNFVSGDKVNETPLFIANITDLNGINTVGSGIGHDLLLTIDQDPSQMYVINDYFQAVADSYSEGSVKYKLPEMKDGKHTLTFRAWDLLNNSATNTVDFEVVKGLSPEIFSVQNYPNPVKTSTRIVITHDRPETVLSTSVEVFDISGQKLWSKSQSTSNDISWDLVGDNGIRVKAGIYFYRVNIKTSNSSVSSKTNKMFVVGQ